MNTHEQPEVILHDPHLGGWLCFPPPTSIIQTSRHADVVPALHELQRAVDSGNRYAAGFISYEAAPAFDPALTVRPPDHNFPLLWFGLFDRPAVSRQPFPVPHPTSSIDQPTLHLDWTPSISHDAYAAILARLRNYLYAGDSYQVNFTLRLLAAFDGDPRALFSTLVHAQGPHYSAFINTGPFAICSASPELFFRFHNGAIESRPMKGTAPRGRTLAEDRHQAASLQASEKNRAENVMIVDMIRNDMGRVAIPGTVTPVSLFDIERYPTVWQMTSTVTCRTKALFPEIMTALFPCASITGAPKRRTMEIIAELEDSPRRIYTGAIGFLAPGGHAQFNVAIRTVLLDRRQHTAEYGVGGGIVWDSAIRDEYDECLLKAGVLQPATPDFSLLETIRWDSDTGFFLLERHFNRLAGSAEYFGIPLSLPGVQAELEQWAAGQPAPSASSISQNVAVSVRIRLLIASNGAISIEAFPLPSPTDTPVRVALAPRPVDAADRFLYHKTTHRRIYEEAKSARPDADDVLLWNSAGEITESTIANVVADADGELITPAIRCGLLPGTFRAELLDQGKIREGVIRVEDLGRCRNLYLINSVRKWRQAAVVVPNPHPINT